MRTKPRHSDSDSPASVLLDVSSRCDCCCFDNVDWKTFLRDFPEHVPGSGTALALRVRIKPASLRNSRSSATVKINPYFLELQRAGTVGTGIVVAACANGH